MSEKPDRYGFYDMAKIIPEGKSGNWGIRHRVITEEECRYEKEMAIYRRDWTCRGLQPGTYCTLYWGNGNRSEIMMSDTWLERYTNAELLQQASGDILIAGLGIGLVVVPLCNNDKVWHVTVVESNLDVVHLVLPYINHTKLSLVVADIFTWNPEQKYDTIYFDIWATICGDNYPETKELHKRYKKWLKNGGWMQSWLRDEVRRLYFE